MKLTYVRAHLSIRAFDPVELPDFVVLTGENGTGKTHLLQAIANGSCKIDDVPTTQVRYFDYTSFALANPAGLTVAQMEQMAQAAHAEFSSWQSLAKHHYQSLLSRWNRTTALANEPELDDLPLNERFEALTDVWNHDSQDSDLDKFVDEYKSTMTTQVFANENLSKGQSVSGILRCIHRVNQPIHLISKDDFVANFVPVENQAHFFGLSLGALFSKYKIDEFRWCHDEFEAGRGKSISKLRSTFRRRHPRPWVVINRLLSALGKYCVSEGIFKFEVTHPEDIELRLSNYAKFSFAPQLLNKVTGAKCDFSSLSSGEKTLLALALSIYGAADDYRMPSVLLLDEIDASLHPSMIEAMLFAIDSAFLSRGVRVILATHSPTTVALAPSESIHLMQLSRKSRDLRNVPREEAIEILTEGLVTLEDGLRIAGDLKRQLNILTEGYNAPIIRRYCELAGIRGVNFIEGLEDRTGKDQLKSYFDLFSAINDKRVLVVWDCDAEKLVARLKETERVFKFCLPRQANAIAACGIENMFPERLLDEFTVELRTKKSGRRRVYFDSSQKSAFAKMVTEAATLDDYSAFVTLKDKIEAIQSS